MPRYTHISVAIPMLAESQNLPALLNRFRYQSWREFTLYCCVNNVEQGYGLDDNLKTLQQLSQVDDLSLVVIDRSSRGNGWTGKKRGVGWARKVLFERIISDRSDDELVISLDADTDFDDNYLEAIAATFNAHPTTSALAVPYYHPLSGLEPLDRPMLRYECYMRHYLLQLQRIHSPYAFTALGSAIAFPLWAYKRVGGITPLQGGEDFYLLQKFAKTGTIINKMCPPYQHLVVRPQGRVSQRVPFGTGPAIGKGVEGMDESYPFYAPEGFDAVWQTYQSFPQLYLHDVPTPMTPFLCQQLATDQLWEPLRQNFKDQAKFEHACAERVDGLRILQFLKGNPAYRLSSSDMPVDFINDTIDTINAYRNQLFTQEMAQRQ